MSSYSVTRNFASNTRCEKSFYKTYIDHNKRNKTTLKQKQVLGKVEILLRRENFRLKAKFQSEITLKENLIVKLYLQITVYPFSAQFSNRFWFKIFVSLREKRNFEGHHTYVDGGRTGSPGELWIKSLGSQFYRYSCREKERNNFIL